MASSLGSRRGSVTVGGATLHYVVEGSGTPILVLGSAVYYPRTFSQWLRGACRLAFADLRHFAASDGASADSISLDTYIEDVEAIRAALGFESFALIGHSHHGNLALEYARRYPENVSHLILIGTPPCDTRTTIEAGRRYWERHAPAARKEMLRRNHGALRADVPGSAPPDLSFVAEYVADGPKYWYDPAFDATPLWHGVPVNLDVLSRFKGFFADYAFDLGAVSMSVPVFVAMGRHDYMVPHVLWNEVLPRENVTYHLLERSGHTPQLEQSAAFDWFLLEWLERASARSPILEAAV